LIKFTRKHYEFILSKLLFFDVPKSELQYQSSISQHAARIISYYEKKMTRNCFSINYIHIIWRSANKQNSKSSFNYLTVKFKFWSIQRLITFQNLNRINSFSTTKNKEARAGVYVHATKRESKNVRDDPVKNAFTIIKLLCNKIRITIDLIHF
jgi:hypothetical protein